MRDLPCWQGAVWRASARPRRVREARRARTVACRRAMSAVCMTPSPCERRRSVSTRAGVPSTMRRSVSTTRQRSSRLTTWASQPWRHGRRRGRPPCPGCTGARTVSRLARRDETTPAVPSQQGPGAAQRFTRAIGRRLRARSRGSLASPPSPTRVWTLMASAIQTIRPWAVTRIAAARTCPRARGGAPLCSCTACPCLPSRASQEATVRSSEPHATTMACRGHPWARSVTTRLLVSAEVRRRYHAGPCVAVHVLPHWVQMKRCSCCEWIPRLPWPVWPLAGQARFGQHVTVLSSSLQRRPTRS